jgi:phage protein U
MSSVASGVCRPGLGEDLDQGRAGGEWEGRGEPTSRPAQREPYTVCDEKRVNRKAVRQWVGMCAKGTGPGVIYFDRSGREGEPASAKQVRRQSGQAGRMESLTGWAIVVERGE